MVAAAREGERASERETDRQTDKGGGGRSIYREQRFRLRTFQYHIA